MTTEETLGKSAITLFLEEFSSWKMVVHLISANKSVVQFNVFYFTLCAQLMVSFGGVYSRHTSRLE